MIIFSPSLPHRVISAGNKSWHRRSLGYYCAPEWWSPGTFLCFYFFFTQLSCPQGSLCQRAKVFLEMGIHAAELCIAVSPEPAAKGRRFQTALQSLFRSDLSGAAPGWHQGQLPKAGEPGYPVFWLNAVKLGSPFIPSSFLLSLPSPSLPPSLPACAPSCLLSLSRQAKSLWANKYYLKLYIFPDGFPPSPSFPGWSACALGNTKCRSLEHAKQQECHKQQHPSVNAAQRGRAS